jgi:hypothetical protein
MTKDEALNLALEALRKARRKILTTEECHATITAIKQAQTAPVQEPLIPDGWSLVAVKGFDDLMYWLDRCERKGHLENCPDLIEPYEAFDYRPVTTPPAAQRQWVGLTDEEILEAAGIDGADTWLFETAYTIEAKLRSKNI